MEDDDDKLIKEQISHVDFYDNKVFKVKNYKYLDDSPENIIIYALAILIGNYSIERKMASILLLKALLRQDFLKCLLENPDLYPVKRTDNRVVQWAKKIKSIGYCEKCGSKEKLEAHHIIGWSEYPQGRIDIKNGICLCLKCHTEKHLSDKSYYLMKAKDVIRWHRD